MIPSCKYFKPYELIDPDILKVLSENACMRLIGHDVTRFLDKLRSDYEGAVRALGLYQSKYDIIIGINGRYYDQLFRYSGLRSKDCKEGSKQSRHKNGNVFDLKCKHIKVLLFLIEAYHEQYGVYKIESPKVTTPRGYIHAEFGDTSGELVVFNP
jgi:hypothetical protein